jgi:hypothetical protein
MVSRSVLGRAEALRYLPARRYLVGRAEALRYLLARRYLLALRYLPLDSLSTDD